MAIEEIMAEVAEKEMDYSIEKEWERADIACELREFTERNWFDESY